MPDESHRPTGSLHHRLAHINSSLRQAANYAADFKLLLDADREADSELAAALFNLDRSLQRLNNSMRKIEITDLPCSIEDGDGATLPPQDSENALLLRALESQELRIRKLEAELNIVSSDKQSSRRSERGNDRNSAQVIFDDSARRDSSTRRMVIAAHDDGNLKIALNSSITTIGREPDNDVQIRSRFVSRFHARIVNDQDGAIIEDMDSRNGISVNTRRVARKKLRSGDYIKLGRVQLQYIDIAEGHQDAGQA